MAKSKDPKLARAGVSGYNKPKRTPGGSKKFVVLAKEGDTTKTIRFGDPNMTIKKDQPARRKSFRARHKCCLLYTSPSPRDGLLSRMPSSA